MKRKITILTIAFLLSGLMCANVFAAATGRCGDSIIWTLDDSGNLTLSGSGEMSDNGFGYNNWTFRYYGTKTVTIGDGITRIGESAFQGCSGMTKLTLPNSLERIGGNAFQDCTGLTELTLPSSVWDILDYAFYGCSGLTELTLPNSLESIGKYAFSGCSGLTELTLPNSVTSIGGYAFAYCSGLSKITSLAEIPPVCGYGVFDGVNKTNCELIVPKGAVAAYKQAYGWNGFSNIRGFSE